MCQKKRSPYTEHSCITTIYKPSLHLNKIWLVTLKSAQHVLSVMKFNPQPELTTVQKTVLRPVPKPYLKSSQISEVHQACRLSTKQDPFLLTSQAGCCRCSK